MESSRSSFSSLFSSLTETASNIFKNEAALFREEISEKVSVASKDLVKIVIGASLLMTGLPALATASILALALFVPAWLAALIFASVVIVLGGIILKVGLNRIKQVNLKPERTVSSVKDTLRAIQEGWQT